MKTRQRGRLFLGCGLLFIVAFVAGIFGIQALTGTGIFYVPGIVTYDESLNNAEKEVLAGIFTEDVRIDADVSIAAVEYSDKPELSEGEFLYDILVPVADFYSVLTEAGDGQDFMSVSELDATKKLLKYEGKSYLDDFASGARFRVIKFSSEKYAEEIAPLVSEKFSKTWPDENSVLTFAQTGVTALSRGMNRKLYSVNDATYFSENIAEYLKSFDLTHTSNESSFSNGASGANICSDPRFKSTLLDIGLDIVELTGNHNLDCGDAAAKETIDFYNENGILVVGGGKTAEEAAQAITILEKGTGITMFAYNLSTGGATYDQTPGANQYYEEKAAAEIAEAKARGDFVIVDVQYYECNSYASKYEDPICDRADSAAGDQVGFFRHLIDLGADIVVGTSAHQPQTFELYNEGAIYYGLGNLFFDQVWWPGTTRSLVLEHYFYNGKLLQTRIQPTVYGNEMQVKLMDEETTKWFLERLISVKP